MLQYRGVWNCLTGIVEVSEKSGWLDSQSIEPLIIEGTY